MRTIRFLAISFLAILVITACSKQELDIPYSLEDEAVLKSAKVDIDIYPRDDVTWTYDGCDYRVYALYAKENIHVGTVSVITTNEMDGSYHYVKYELDEGSDCMFTEAHVYVGWDTLIPLGKKGNPKIGHFPYAWEDPIGSSMVIMKIPMDESWYHPVFAAHAVIKCGEDEKAAWAKTSPVVFALHSNMRVDESNYQAAITGHPGIWCSNFDYLPVIRNLGKTFDLVYYEDGYTVLGQVYFTEVWNVVRFYVTSIYGGVDDSYLFVGSVDKLNKIGICNYQEFPYKDLNKEDEHYFGFYRWSNIFARSFRFEGGSWGWYTYFYAVHTCPDWK